MLGPTVGWNTLGVVYVSGDSDQPGLHSDVCDRSDALVDLRCDCERIVRDVGREPLVTVAEEFEESASSREERHPWPS